jgi:hypothetical protein
MTTEELIELHRQASVRLPDGSIPTTAAFATVDLEDRLVTLAPSLLALAKAVEKRSDRGELDMETEAACNTYRAALAQMEKP